MSQSTKTPSIIILLAFLILLMVFGAFMFIQSRGDTDKLSEEELILDGYTPPTGPPPTDEEWEMFFSDDSQLNTERSKLDESEVEDSNLQSQLVRLVAEIEAIISTEATTVEQCKLVAMGHAPCGGPGYYLPYAVTGADEANLLDLASRHRDLSQTQNAQSGLMGICVITPVPELVIVDGQCVFDVN